MLFCSSLPSVRGTNVEGVTASESTPVPVPQSGRQAAPHARWERLCALLDDDEAVAKEIVVAAGHGDAAAWARLLDELDDGGNLAYLDVGDTGDLLVDALVALPRIAAAGVDLRAVCDVDDLHDAVAAADEALAAHGLTLLALAESDGDDDCLPLVAVARERVREIVDLVAELGQRLLPLPGISRA